MHHSNPHHKFSNLFNFIWYFSCICWFFELNDPVIEKHYKWSPKRLKVVMVSSFHPHSMCKKVERVTAKTGCTSCTKRTISFEVWGFRTKTHLLQRDFIFWTYLNSRIFVCSNCTIQSHIINLQPFLTSFVIFHAFTDYFELKTMKLKSMSNELW